MMSCKATPSLKRATKDETTPSWTAKVHKLLQELGPWLEVQFAFKSAAPLLLVSTLLHVLKAYETLSPPMSACVCTLHKQSSKSRRLDRIEFKGQGATGMQGDLRARPWARRGQNVGPAWSPRPAPSSMILKMAKQKQLL